MLAFVDILLNSNSRKRLLQAVCWQIGLSLWTTWAQSIDNLGSVLICCLDLLSWSPTSIRLRVNHLNFKWIWKLLISPRVRSLAVGIERATTNTSFFVPVGCARRYEMCSVWALRLRLYAFTIREPLFWIAPPAQNLVDWLSVLDGKGFFLFYWCQV